MEFKPDDQLTGYVAKQIRLCKLRFWISTTVVAGLALLFAAISDSHIVIFIMTVYQVMLWLIGCYYIVNTIGKKINTVVNVIDVSEKLTFATFAYRFMWLNLKPLVYKCDRVDLYWRYSELPLKANNLPANQTINIQNTAGPTLFLVYNHYNEALLTELHINAGVTAKAI